MAKYGNKKVAVDNIVFDSAIESRYYIYLSELQKQGVVTDIALQPVFTLQESFRKEGKLHRAITYKADFQVSYADGRTEIVDIKGFTTTDFKIKQKMFEYRYRELRLILLTFSKIDGGWIELDQLAKNRKARKKAKVK